MAQMVAVGVVTAGVLQSVSGRVVVQSLEMAMTAASGLARLLRASVAQLQANPAVREELAAMDIEAKVQTVQALLMTMRRLRAAGPGSGPSAGGSTGGVVRYPSSHHGGSTSSSASGPGSGPASSSSNADRDTDSLVLVEDGDAFQVATPDEDVVEVCLRHVSQALEAMTKTLEALNAELAEHPTRWFAAWRAPDTATYVATLRAQAAVLDKRVDFLLKCHQAFSGMGAGAGAGAS